MKRSTYPWVSGRELLKKAKKFSLLQNITTTKLATLGFHRVIEQNVQSWKVLFELSMCLVYGGHWMTTSVGKNTAWSPSGSAAAFASISRARHSTIAAETFVFPRPLSLHSRTWPIESNLSKIMPKSINQLVNLREWRFQPRNDAMTSFSNV